MAVLYVGSYTQSIDGVSTGSQGMYVLDVNTDQGTYHVRQTVERTPNPSFLTICDDILYACGEMQQQALVSAYRCLGDGRLEWLNTMEGPGIASCHVAAHPMKPLLFVTNYFSGNVLSYMLKPDGRVGKLVGNCQHFGQSSNPIRQERAHTHSVALPSDGAYVAVADLGLDCVFLYEAEEAGQLSPIGEPICVPSGEGPRHMAFSSDGAHVYLVTEMGNHLFHFSCRSNAIGKDNNRWRKAPVWKLEQQLDILPKGFPKGSDILAADVHISPDGRFVYVSSRGFDGLVAYQIGSEGMLELVGRYACGGKGPRNFCISPDGRWVAAANQYSGTLAFLPRNRKTGTLDALAFQVEVPQAVCVLWTEKRE